MPTPRAPRGRLRPATLLLTVVLLAATGCGGGSTDRGDAAARPTEAATTWPPDGASGEYATYLWRYGVSWKAPRSWKLSVDSTDAGAVFYSWSTGKKGKGGFMSVTVRNARDTAQDWADDYGSYAAKDSRKTLDDKVEVPGYGTGIHRRWASDKGTSDTFVVTSIDGVLLDMTVVTPKGGSFDVADTVVASVRRKTS